MLAIHSTNILRIIRKGRGRMMFGDWKKVYGVERKAEKSPTNPNVAADDTEREDCQP
jgi:hypothetical protein